MLALDVTPCDVGLAARRSCCGTRVPAVRPDDVLTGLRQVGGLEARAAPLVTRLAQGPLDEATGAIGDPLSG